MQTLMSKLTNSNINTTSIVSGTSWLMWTAIVWMPRVTQDTEDVIVSLIVCIVYLFVPRTDRVFHRIILDFPLI